jgi:hypothetical protein
MLDYPEHSQEFWLNQKKLWPQRSRLYPLQPLGLGTPLVESFTSYIKRLAAIHQVPTGVLLAQELAPSISRYKGPNPQRLSSIFFHLFFNQTGAWNGTGTMATEPLFLLQKLTNQPTLKFLTLISWAKVLPTRNLLRKYNSWCPLCYYEWGQNGVPIHEPLIWSIATIIFCPQHQQPLMSKCPNCQNNIYPLAWNSRAGFCCQCHSWLGNSCSTTDAQILSAHEREWQTFAAYEVGKMLSHAPFLFELPQKETVAASIDLCIQKATLGNNQDFASKFYLSATVPRDWRTGNALPQLNLLLRVCYRISISLIDIYLGNLVIQNHVSFKDLPDSQQKIKTNRHFDAPKVKEFLELHQDSEPPLSLRQIAAHLGYDPADLNRHFPDLCHQISARYKLHNKFSPRRHV